MSDGIQVEALEDGTPYQPLYGDVYCSRSGAAQARRVFVEGTALVERLVDDGEAVVLETGFGLGLNAAAALDAAADASRVRGAAVELRFVSIELHAVEPSALRSAHAALGLSSPGHALVQSGYPALLDRGVLEPAGEGWTARVELVRGDGARALAGLDLAADALFLDGFAPDRNPGLWNDAVFAELSRLAAPGARLATYTVARRVRDGLTRAGFDVTRLPGYGRKRHRLVGVRRART
ncbi:MAG: tRNA (5-methylaminomethyl-2-thiouridine)(34)-methyltransferase MnmD [Planctomycetota bacterium]